METFNNLEQENVTLEVTENSKKYLDTATFWSKFMAVLQFIAVSFMAMAGLILIVAGPFIGNYPELPIPISLFGFFYLGFAILMFLPALYLFRFANKTAKALANNYPFELEGGFKNMKSYWKFMGIMTIVMLGACLTIVPIIVIIAVASGIQ